MTVTTCATFQLAWVKVSDEVETTPSAVLSDEIGIVTSYSGAEFSTTLNWAVPPSSVVSRSLGGIDRRILVLAADQSDGNASALGSDVRLSKSEVLCEVRSVAVALDRHPHATLADKSVVKLAFPLVLVVTVV